MESNHHEAPQCQLKSPWPEEIPGGNTRGYVSSLSKDEALIHNVGVYAWMLE